MTIFCGNPHIKLRNHLGLLANHLSSAGSAQRQSRLFDHVVCASRECRQHIEPEALAVVTRPQGPLPTNMGKAYATAIMDMTRLASSGSRSALCGFRSARTSKTILSVS